MNIVLATSPSEEDKHGVRSMAPLSLGYLAACLKKYPEANVRIVVAYGEGLTVSEGRGQGPGPGSRPAGRVLHEFLLSQRHPAHLQNQGGTSPAWSR